MRVKVAVIALAMVLAGMLTARAADEKEKAKDEAKANGRGKLTLPWSKISSLSEDQKNKIWEIHTKARDEISAINKREKEEIMSLLNDDQKAEAKQISKDAAKKTADEKAASPPAATPAN